MSGQTKRDTDTPPGLSAAEFALLCRKVRESANLTDKAMRRSAMMKTVGVYLQAEPQRVAREKIQDQDEFLKRIVEFQTRWLQGVASDPKRPSETDLQQLESLLNQARAEPVAHEAVQRLLRELIQAGKKPEILLDFVADDWAGLVSTSSKTRRQKPHDWHRQEQIAASVCALVLAGTSQNEAIRVVAEAAQAAGIVWTKTYATEAVTFENVRGAWRASARFRRLSKDGGISPPK
ncbi:hypothetical protein ACFORG_07270 [Lutimaribacter marinistellae]|uniref:Uncharacterized protein n=1 Tax=Lutimaribacter marinistellae TaxID=1820329 RepID=A0ABV7TDA8_9RHOB